MPPQSSDHRQGLHVTSRGRLALALLLATAAPPACTAFDFATVVHRAERLAAHRWKEPSNNVPDWLLKLSYDQFRDIRFRPEQAIWRDRKLAFEVQLFHPGLYYNRTVAISLVEKDKVTPLAFSPTLFDYGQNDFASRVPQDLGFAGFRLHYPLKRKDYHDEAIVFLGASYFRSLGKDQVFGLSARGLAVDTAESWGEEFPYFREFWLVEPERNAKEMTLYALLDSPRVTGAYHFVVAPGDETVVKVECQLFLRKTIEKLGIAPLTSMFFRGENTARWFNDFRPEVHDSDGLLINFKSGEWLWRPLDNPKTLSVSQFRTESPVGFGLSQRDRSFESYQDLETQAERRPSAWIAPDGDWGPGRVEVVEIPTNDDRNDNIVAYWVPEQQPVPGQPVSFAYQISWYGDDASRPPGGRVIATRRDTGTHEGVQRFVIDFAGKQLSAIPADQVLRGVITVAGGAAAGEIVEQHVVKNPFTGGWRLTFQVRPYKREPLELRAFLDEGGTVLTETWSYVLLP
jgi:glucans biosynthesis protein